MSYAVGRGERMRNFSQSIEAGGGWNSMMYIYRAWIPTPPGGGGLTNQAVEGRGGRMVFGGKKKKSSFLTPFFFSRGAGVN